MYKNLSKCILNIYLSRFGWVLRLKKTKGSTVFIANEKYFASYDEREVSLLSHFQ